LLERNALAYFYNYLNRIAVSRKKWDDKDGGLRFLKGQYPKATRSFEREWVQSKIVEANGTQSYQERLNKAWEAIVMLCDVPWQEKKNSGHLDLWDEALSVWDKASAWYGLHGFIFNGKLAADNTLLAVRSLRASFGEILNLKHLIRSRAEKTGCVEHWANLYSLGGALASEYYSIAKTMSAKTLRRHYLLKADAWIDVAERTYEIEGNKQREVGLSSIRGHIYLELGRVRPAIKKLERSLELRKLHGPSSASLGEAKADLGYAYFRMGRREVAEAFLTEGVDALEHAMVPGFTIRAKRKLAEYYYEIGNHRDCFRQIAEASAISRKYGVRDQFGKLALLPIINSKDSRKIVTIASLKVKETNNGYRYEEE
jgi:tetratricopeptide (TPR) repeat protein